MTDNNGVFQYGPFLPVQEGRLQRDNEEEFIAPLPPPPPPLLYPRGVCTAAWDKARLQLGLLLSRAAADVGAAPSTAAAAVVAFQSSFPSFFHIDPSAISSCLAASLFLSGKAADEEFNLRRVVASLGFCSHHAAAAAEEKRQQQLLQQQQKLQQQQQSPPQACTAEYVALGIKEYWRQRQSCFLEEQRLMQALAFSFPNPTLWEHLPLMLMLLRSNAAEAAVATALIADAAAGALAAEGQEHVVVAAACLLARKLIRRFKDRIRQQQQQQQNNQYQRLNSPSSGAVTAASLTPEHKGAAVETVQLLEDEICMSVGTTPPAEGETYSVLLGILPLLQGIRNSSDQCHSTNRGPLCQQLSAAAKKMLLQYALLLDETKGHQVYRHLAGGAEPAD
ncbi:uncharacterized protein LOC34619469 [Cyclospora cayetanensis]|uniref:Uncharacterized protein LOC34619469 n=1 Tax=Cyclospora cayetanensis TaxID=88456 RepID=A0A6P6S3U1_9EIME|nr:uncharacterized protein LOC34619469 [Cyclospora cayetanensis]